MVYPLRMRRRLLPDRRVYARKRYGYGSRRRGFVSNGMVGKNHMGGCLAVYHNPFSTATTNPKIPDGKCYSSSGIRLQAVQEFTNDGTGPMDFLLFPGLSCGCVGYSMSGSSNATSMAYKDHGRWTEGTPPLTQVESAPIHKWRLVSQALKLTLINNSDENDGWFEAIRVQGSADSGFGPTLQTAAGPGAFISSANRVDIPAATSISMVESPSYCTGKLRDIHRYMFHLMPQGNDHEFNILPREADNEEDFNNCNLDNESYDMIFIRVHGRAGSTSPTRIMAHLVSNQEIIYDERSFMTRHHSETRGDDRTFQNSRKRRQQNPANTSAGLVPRQRIQRTTY